MTTQERDKAMKRKGYACAISHPAIGEELYLKSPGHVGPVLRHLYPTLKGVRTRMIK